MTVTYQSDFKISLADEVTGRMTLALSPTGDIQLVEGKEKLAEQLLFAIVNDNVSVSNLLNAPTISTRALTALMQAILRDFKQNQIEYTNKSDPELNGHLIFRKKSGTTANFERVSKEYVSWRFTDTDLENGILYDYGVRKVYNGIFTTMFVDSFTIVPSKFPRNQVITIGSESVAWSGDQTVTFYIDSNRYFKRAELLGTIIRINSYGDPREPRKQIVDILIQSLDDAHVSINSRIGNAL